MKTKIGDYKMSATPFSSVFLILYSIAAFKLFPRQFRKQAPIKFEILFIIFHTHISFDMYLITENV